MTERPHLTWILVFHVEPNNFAHPTVKITRAVGVWGVLGQSCPRGGGKTDVSGSEFCLKRESALCSCGTYSRVGPTGAQERLPPLLRRNAEVPAQRVRYGLWFGVG